jgi:hypothetical protein
VSTVNNSADLDSDRRDVPLGIIGDIVGVMVVSVVCRAGKRHPMMD